MGFAERTLDTQTDYAWPAIADLTAEAVSSTQVRLSWMSLWELASDRYSGGSIGQYVDRGRQ